MSFSYQWKKRPLSLLIAGIACLFITGATVEMHGVLVPPDTSGQYAHIYLKGVVMFEEIIELAKAVQSERTTADRILCNSPLILLHVALVSDDVGVATAVIYDGNSADGKQRYDLSAVKGGLDIRDYWPGAYFTQGLYVDVGSNVTSFTADFIPIKQ